MLPFSQREFFELFERYNEAIWPLQVFAYVLGAISVLATFSSHRLAGVICLSSLALLWGWTGVAYHWVFFSSIKPIAPVFAAVFVGQALILAFAAIRRPPQFSTRSNVMTLAGWGLIAYAAVLYPVLNAWLGHPIPRPDLQLQRLAITASNGSWMRPVKVPATATIAAIRAAICAAQLNSVTEARARLA
ncbi:DUF6064 family protein [Hyphomonas sp. BRH_c22]|uniref:DUF6064 family protein n=1 Tax=Hyphomonas sp. BRH_c22 TaxID=1629710 RepID=UPI000B0E8E6E|nr:DUF6064 family protein [Hyphomonas sp. BRH_c22]